MSVAEENAIGEERKTGYGEDSTDSDNETERKALLRRISTSKCVGRLPVVKEGYLMKQTRSFQRWQRRYFKLRGRTLYYAKEKDSQLWDEHELEDATFAECSISNANHSFQFLPIICEPTGIGSSVCGKMECGLNTRRRYIASYLGDTATLLVRRQSLQENNLGELY
nr:diacylglycerol kinase eta-like [Vanessa tameamea]